MSKSKKDAKSASLATNKFQEERMELIGEVFDLFDKDQSGTIDKNDLNSVMVAIGRVPEKNEMDQFIKKFDKNKNGKIEKNEFMDALKEFYTVPDETVNDVINAFKIFDKNNNGKVTLSELKHILLKYCKDFSESEVDEIFSMIDTDGSGEISYEEFVHAWQIQ